MGSLMAGWQTNRSDSRQASKAATSSVTQNEVEKFKRARESSLKRHLRYIEALQDSRDLEQRSSNNSGSHSECTSPTSTPSAGSSPSSFSEEVGRQAWWTKSTWAFLNNPPLTEDRSIRYTTQFDVADICGNSSLVKRRNSMPACL